MSSQYEFAGDLRLRMIVHLKMREQHIAMEQQTRKKIRLVQ